MKWIVLIVILVGLNSCSERVILHDYRAEYQSEVVQYKAKGLDTLSLYREYQVKIAESNRVDSILKVAVKYENIN